MNDLRDAHHRLDPGDPPSGETAKVAVISAVGTWASLLHFRLNETKSENTPEKCRVIRSPVGLGPRRQSRPIY